MVRLAGPADIDALVAIEERCFDDDRLSRRSFRHMVTRGHAATLVDDEAGVVRGYIMLLFHGGTSLARIYSLAVDPDHRGRGVARRLLLAAEDVALEKDCLSLRLEVRTDNAVSIQLYESLGYRRFGVYEEYYEDDTDALRYEKSLRPAETPDLARVPYYQQTLEFTCGPAAVMMAMRALSPDIDLDRRLEIRLWRESTTVFMTSGPGGCGPFGLALAVHRRGFPVEVFVKDDGVHFVDSVRNEEKKEVIRLVHDDFAEEIRRSRIPVHERRLGLEELQAAYDDGGIAVVLISSYRIYREKSPHWVVVTGFDDRFVYLHDSYVDVDEGKTVTESINMPVLRSEFERMSSYGRSGLRAAVVIRAPGTDTRRRPGRRSQNRGSK